MATLTGKTIASTYKDLLQVSNSNSGIDETKRAVSDGEATASPLELSSAAVNISSGFELGGSAVTASATELNYVGGVTSAIQTQIDAKAPLASPTLTGTPIAPTAGSGTDTTQIATTAFVQSAVQGEDTLAEMNDTSLSSPDDSDFLVHNGTAWVNESGATARTSLGVDASGTINYTHPNHSGDVTSVSDGATTIANDAVTYAKMQNVSATDRILGRDTSGAGIVEEITPANVRAMINVEDGSTADQSNAEIKTAYEANADTNEFSDAEQTKLSGIEASADVTDSTNVNSAGAVMESDISGTPAGSIIDDDTMASASNTTLATSESIKAYAQSLVASSVEYIGGYNASTNSPDLDTSPSGVTKGDMYTVTTAGTFFTQDLEVGDVLISEQDSPTALTHWSVVNKDLDASSIKTSYESNADTNAYTDAEVTKLSGIATSATANDTDVNLKARANHTGTQTASTISDFDTEVANNSAVTTNTAKVSNVTHTGDVTGSTSLSIASDVVGATELGVTAGTVTASKAVVVDANKQVDAMHFSGDVGIGTDSPLSQFHVEGATTGEMTIGQYSGGYLSGNDVGALKFYGWDNSGGGAGKGDISKITGTWGDDNGDGQSIAGSTTEGGRLEFWTGKRASGDSPPTLTEKMVIDQNGNVGIGTASTTNDAKLIVAGTDGKHPVIKAGGGGGGYTIIANNYTATESIFNMGISYSGANAVLSRSVKVSDVTNDVYLSSQAQFTVKPSAFVLDGDGSFQFLNTDTSATTAVDTAVSLTNRMTIDSAGNVLVGTTDTTPGIGDTNVGISMSAVNGIIISRADDAPINISRNSSNGDIALFRKDGTTVGSISVTGASTSYNESSDYRLKENVEPMSGSIDKLKQLKPCNFNFIVDPDDLRMGFLAHEVSAVVPQAISGEKDAMKEQEISPAIQAVESVEGQDEIQWDDKPSEENTKDEIKAWMDSNSLEYNSGDTKQDLIAKIPELKQEAVQSVEAVEAVEAVYESVPDYQGIDQSKLVPLLVSAVQELLAKVEALESK